MIKINSKYANIHHICINSVLNALIFKKLKVYIACYHLVLMKCIGCQMNVQNRSLTRVSSQSHLIRSRLVFFSFNEESYFLIIKL